jgi:hypothetical protein
VGSSKHGRALDADKALALSLLHTIPEIQR